MSNERNELYEFGQFRLDVREHKLERLDGYANGSLPEKTFQILCILVQNSGHLLTKGELMDLVWPDSFVEENNLDKRIHAIRNYLGEKPGEQKYIETVRLHGYRFVADVTKFERDEVSNGGTQTESGEDQVFAHALPERLTESGAHAIVNLAEWRRVVKDEQFEGSYSPPVELADKTIASPTRRTSAFRWRLAAGAAAVLVIVAVGTYFYFQSGARAPSFAMSNIRRITTNGNSSYPALSPDGKYIAYVSRGAKNRLSMRLLHIETGAATEIYSPTESKDIVNPSFSPDGNFIYFVQSDAGSPAQALFRMSVLGGVPQKVVDGLQWYAASPDGTRLAYTRKSRETGESLVVISKTDGTGEYQLATRPQSEPYSFLSWSPDNRSIAVSVGSREVSGERMYPVEISLDDGSQREITSERWQYLSFVHYTADGRGLLVSGSDLQTSIIGAWHLSRSSGEANPLTGIPEVYTVNSQTADSRTFAAQTVKLDSNIWVAEVGDDAITQARQITTGNDGGRVSFMPDGRILFTTGNSRSMPDIWVMNADGTGRKQLTTADQGINSMPSASPDGRYILFDSDRAGSINIWRMDADGGNPKQLTFGKNEKGPSISPDGKWVAYTSGDYGTLWRVPIDGGTPERLGSGLGVVYSPDGKWIISTSDWRFRLLPAAGGEPVRKFGLPAGLDINLHGGQWLPDGSAFIFVAGRDGIWNVYRQPIVGGDPVQLTDFQSTDEIYSPAFSPDGKQLVFSRGGWRFDIYLLRGLK